MTTDYTIALAQLINDKVSSATTGTARGTVVAVSSDGTVTFSVGSYTTPRKGIYLGPGVPQVGDVIVYFDEGTGFPLVLGATGPRDLSIDATKAFIVGNTRLTTAGLTVNGVSYTPTAWTLVTFENGWSNAGAPWFNVSYRAIGDIVYLRGRAAGGTVSAGAAVFHLPAAFRPPGGVTFAVSSNNAHGQVVVGSDGAVAVSVGNNTYVSFDGVTFSISS